MAYTKKPEFQKYRALVNLSVGRLERGPNGREERADRVEKGGTVDLTVEEAANFGRLVRLVETEETTQVPARIRPKDVLGIKGVDKGGSLANTGTGVLDMKNTTTVIRNEAEEDEEAQPTKNPVDPSYVEEAE